MCRCGVGLRKTERKNLNTMALSRHVSQSRHSVHDSGLDAKARQKTSRDREHEPPATSDQYTIPLFDAGLHTDTQKFQMQIDGTVVLRSDASDKAQTSKRVAATRSACTRHLRT